MPHSTPPAARLRPWFAAALLIAFTGAAAGELYQWKDAQGVTHYADAPPPDRAYTNRVIRERGNADTAAPEAAETAQCMTARLNLEHLQGSAPVGFDANGDGKPDSSFSAEERAAQVGKATAAVRAHCSPAPAQAG